MYIFPIAFKGNYLIMTEPEKSISISNGIRDPSEDEVSNAEPQQEEAPLEKVAAKT